MDIEEKYGLRNQIYQCMAYNMKPLILMSKDVIDEVAYHVISAFKTSEEIEANLRSLDDGSLIAKYRGIDVYEVRGRGVCKVVADTSI